MKRLFVQRRKSLIPEWKLRAGRWQTMSPRRATDSSLVGTQAEPWHRSRLMGCSNLKRLSLVFVLAVAGTASALGDAIGQDSGSSSSSVSQISLPRLRLERTLATPNETTMFGRLQSGNSHLAISPDGERLAAYVRNGLEIMTWSLDGKYQRALPRYTSFGLDSYVLGFLAGHHLLISSPAAETNDAEGWKKIEDVAFSILDADTGQVLRNIPGLNPGTPSNKNIAVKMAISRDERLVAVILRQLTESRIAIFSSDDWHQVTELDLRTTGDKEDNLNPQALAFSPDGKTLAIAHGFHGRIKFYEVGSWKLLRSIITFPETPPPLNVLLLDAIAFSPDGTTVAVAVTDGGSWWVSKDNRPAKEGVGVLKQFFPADPLRIFRVSDGERVSSLGSFPGGLDSNAQLAWSAKGDYLAFIDRLGDVRLWNPLQPGLSVAGARIGPHAETVLLSKDGSHLFANFPDGIKIFNITAPPSRAKP
jgi:WD40 repeat protein